MYALLLSLGMATLLAAVGVLEGSRASRARWLAAYVIAGTLGLYTHFYAALLLGTIGVVAVVHSARLGARHGVAAWIGAHLVVALAFLPWLGVAVSQVQLAASVEDWAGVAPLQAANWWAAALLADGAPAAQSGAALALALVGTAVGGWRLRARPLLAVLLVALVVIPLALVIALAGPTHAFRPRGFIAVAPALWLLLVIAVAPGSGGRGSHAALSSASAHPREGAGALTAARWRGWNRLAQAVTAVGLLLLTGVGFAHHNQERKEDWRAAAGLVTARAGATDPIFFVHFAGEVAFDHYFSGPQPRVGLPRSFSWQEGYRAPYRVTLEDVQRELPPALEGKRRAWLVLSHDAGRGSDLVMRYLERWSGPGGNRIEVPLIGVRVLSYTRGETASG